MINFLRNTSTSTLMEHKTSKYYQTICTDSFMLFIVVFLLIFTGCSPVD